MTVTPSAFAPHAVQVYRSTRRSRALLRVLWFCIGMAFGLLVAVGVLAGAVWARLP